MCRNFRADGLVVRWDEAVLALKDSRRTRAVKVLLEPARLSLCLGSWHGHDGRVGALLHRAGDRAANVG